MKTSFYFKLIACTFLFCIRMFAGKNEVYSQSINFNGLYSDSSFSSSFTSTIEMNTKMYSVGVVSSISGSGKKGYFIATDKFGNSLFKKKFKSPDTGYNSIAFSDLVQGGDYFYITGTLYKLDTTRERGYTVDPIVLKYDTLGNLIWYKSLDISSRYFYDLPKITYHLGRIRIVSSIVFEGPFLFDIKFRNIYLVFDTNGNYLDSEIYWNFGNYPFEFITDNIPLENGKMILTGFRSFSKPQYRDNGLVFKVDSLGRTIWQKYYGDTAIKHHLISAVKLKDGNVLACGYKARITDSTGLNKHYDAWLVKLNPINGDTIWTKTVKSFYYSSASMIFELNSGDLILAGGKVEVGRYDPVAEIMRTDHQGNLLWTKRYDWGTDSIALKTTFETVYSIIQTENGGLVLSGNAQGINPIVQQSGWLLKLDSNGCLVAGCGSVGIVEYEVFSSLTFKAYPNPAQDRVQLAGELQDGDVVTLYDFTGKILHQQVINSSEIPEIAVSEYANGIYLLSLYRSGYNKATQKLVIAR